MMCDALISIKLVLILRVGSFLPAPDGPVRAALPRLPAGGRGSVVGMGLSGGGRNVEMFKCVMMCDICYEQVISIYIA